MRQGGPTCAGGLSIAWGSVWPSQVYAEASGCSRAEGTGSSPQGFTPSQEGGRKRRTQRAGLWKWMDGGWLRLLLLWPAAGGVCPVPSQTETCELSQAHTVRKGQGPIWGHPGTRMTRCRPLCLLTAHRVGQCMGQGQGLALGPHRVKASRLSVNGGACWSALADAAQAPSPAPMPGSCMEASGELPSLICSSSLASS